MLFKATILASLLLLPLFGAAQAFRLSHFGVEDGLPSSEVYDILQDELGYLWFGTDRGAARFDGEEFMQVGSADGLHDETVFELELDHQGRVWFGTFSASLSFWEHDSLRDYPFNPQLEACLKGSSVKSALKVTESGAVFLGTYEKGLVEVDPGGVSKQHMSPSVGTCRAVDGDPVVFLTTMGNIPENVNVREELNVVQGADSLALLPENSGEYYTINCVKGGGSAWYLVFGQRIFKLHGGNITWMVEPPKRAVALMVDSEERVWVGLASGGVMVLDSNGKKESWKFPQLEGETVSDIFRDREGGYWFATIGAGIHYLPALQFPYFPFQSEREKDKLADLVLQSDTLLQVGMGDGTLWEIRAGEKSAWKIQALDQVSFSPLLLREKDTLWIIAKRVYQRVGPEKKKIPDLKLNGHSKDAIYLANGEFLVGMNRGLVHFDKWGKREVESRARIYSLCKDSRGRVWVGDLDGLRCWEKGSITASPWKHPAAKSRIMDIVELPDGRIACAAASFGVVVFGGGDVEVYGERNGMLSNVVNCMAVDPEGFLWAGGNRGIQRLDLRQPGPCSIRTFDLQHGMPFMEVDHIEAGDSMVWFGGPHGISGINRLHMPQPSPPPPVFLSQVSVNGMPRPFASGISLPHSQNDLTFAFQGLHFRTRGPFRFRYRLAGLHEDWRMTKDREAAYSAIPPGDYRFEVAGRNEDGLWSAPASMDLRIQAPVWTEWWFILGGVLLLGLGTGGTAHYFFRQQRRRLAGERALEEWKLKALRARMNPHFTFNTLNIIQAYISTHDTESAELYLNKFARLIRLVMQQSDEAWVKLGEEMELLALYLDLNQMRFQEAFDYALEVGPGVDREGVMLPAMVVQPFVENAVLHGLLPKQEGGRLRITFVKEGEWLVCTVEDNGVGRAAARKRKAERNGGHRSAGMGLVADRLSLLGGFRGEAIEVEDLVHPDGRPRGTRVNLMIPMKKNRWE